MAETKNEESKDSEKKIDAPVNKTETNKDDASKRLSSEVWAAKPGDNGNGTKDATADRIEKAKPFADDPSLRAKLNDWVTLNKKDSAAEPGQLRRFDTFLGQINDMIKDKNKEGGAQIPEIDRARYGRVLSVVERYQSNQDNLNEALKKNDKGAIERLSKEQEEIKKQMETKEFRKDLQDASNDLSKGYSVLRQGLATTYDGLLKTLVEFGRKVPAEQLPQELPRGIRGLAISNEQFKSLVSDGQLKLPERNLAPNELPKSDDMKEINKLLRFTDAASAEIHRGMLEQQYALAQSRVNQIDSSGELSKKWFPEKVENLNDDQIEKRLAAATPWIQKGLEVQRYAELHHRFNKMVNEQFNWPSWLGGIPSKWDASAIENNKDIVSVSKDEKTGKVSISVKMPDSLDRNDANTDRIKQMDDWLAKYKGPVDQAFGQIDGAKAENSVIYWGDIKTEMRVDKDGNMVEKGWRDDKGRQVFQESDGRKYRFNDDGAKEWVPQNEKLTEGEYRVVNGKTDWLKQGEEIQDVNLMEFRTEAKEVKGPDGKPLIEIKQVQNLQYAHWASYNGWGWVSDVKTMGGDIKAQKLDNDFTIAADKGAAGGRRDGHKGDYLVTLADGRQQVIDEKSFDKLYRQKEGGKPGEYEEKPRQYKPDDWLVVYRTDSGAPQPTLMQAKDVPAFVSSQAKWHWGTKIVTTGVDVLMLASGVGEVRAAMVGVEAAAGTAAKMTTMQVLGKALLTRQGMTGMLHAGFGATGFMGQGIENLGPYGKTFMHARGIAMMLDLGYTAIGRPWSAKPFVPTAEQIASQGFFSRGLLNFNRVMSDSLLGRVQSGGADLFFLSDIGIRQIPGIVNRARGTDSQQVQQQAALERRWPQATLPEDRKTPSSFDKQTMMRVEAFRKPTEDAMKLPEQDPQRVALNKRLIETVKDAKADPRDRMGAAFALVTLNEKDGKLPEKISAGESNIDRKALQDYVDSQRYLQAKEVVDGYARNMSLHVAPELQGKLDALSARAKAALSDNVADRTAAMGDLISTFNSSTASAEEKLIAASALLFARRRGQDGKLAETVEANGQNVKAKDLVDFLYASSQARQGSGSSAKDNPGYLRLYAGDMMLRLDTDRFSIADMNQICLSIVNDKNAPTDAAAKERWTQLKMQAMSDPHGYRLGDLYELMKSRVEPEIANMPTGDQKQMEAKGQALASLLGRDSDAIKASLENLKKNDDPRVAALAGYMLFSAEAQRPSDRIEGLSQLHKDGPLAWPTDFNKDAQNRWAQAADAYVLSKLKADLPGQAGAQFDKASWEKFRAAEQLIAKYPDLKSSPEMQSEINKALMSLISADNPALAAKALPVLLSRSQQYASIFKQMKPEELTAPMKSLRDGLFGSGGILDTLKDSSLDMLNDSSTYSTYATRAENLRKDLQAMQTDYVAKREKMSETERAETESKIAELAQSMNNAASAPADLKRALLASVPSMINLAKDNPLGAPRDLNLRPVVNAVQALAQVQADRPETASPDLRAQAVSVLADIGRDNTGVSTLLTRVLSDDPSPKVRLAALESLNKLAPEDLQRICLNQLAVEQHPEVAKRLREIEFTKRRPDPDSTEYQERFNRARLDLINQAARSLTGAEQYIKNNNDLKYLDGQTLRLQALADLQDKYFNGVGGFFRFAWDGEKGVDSEHAKLLDKYAGYMRDSMDALGRKAATDDEALKALVYVAMSNGRPLLKDDRKWGAEKATEKLKEICANASAERARQISWAVENLLLHQPDMTAQGRQNVLDGLKSLIAKPGQSGMTDGQISTLLATALQRELRNTPAPGAKDFAAREKLQLDMLNTLNEPRFRSREILPALEAIADGTPKFKISKDRNGDVNKVTYADGSSREIQKSAGTPFRYVYKDSAGKETVWLADPSKPNTWYKETDKDKKEPWVGTGDFDSSGDYVRVSDKGVKSVIKPSGAQVDSINGNVSKITYPDGSMREFDPPGNNYRRFTFTSSDGKTKEVWERDGNSNTFYKPDDKEKKSPWTGQELLDANSGDYVSIQGDTRRVRKANGAVFEIKDGAVKQTASASDIAYNSSLASVRQKAQEMVAQMADRSDLLRQQAVLPKDADAAFVGKKIADELSNPNASSERVGRAIAVSEKLGPIKDDNDPRRNVLQIAARDGHELVRMMAARELSKSSNADDRKLAYSVLARLEKQGSRQGYVNESHELLAQIIANPQTSASDKQVIEQARQEANKLDAATYRSQGRTADLSNDLDYQDAFERASRDLKENALKRRNLSKYEGTDNWFSKNDAYNLLDADKLAEAQKTAAHDAFPGFVPWLFMSRASIDKQVDDAVKEVWNRQERQLNALGEQAKQAGDAGREAREALASILLTQGQPFRESDRVWAMQKAAKMVRDCIKDGHPGARDMMWVVQAALIEEPQLDQSTRYYLMNAVDQAKQRGIIDAKEASITMAAALESEYQGMPSQNRAAQNYKDSIENQKYAINLIAIWNSPEASPVLEALSNYHPDNGVRSLARDVYRMLNLRMPQLRGDAGGNNGDSRADAGTANGAQQYAAIFDDPQKQLAFNQTQNDILEYERVLLGLPSSSSPDQIRAAWKAKNPQNS